MNEHVDTPEIDDSAVEDDAGATVGKPVLNRCGDKGEHKIFTDGIVYERDGSTHPVKFSSSM